MFVGMAAFFIPARNLFFTDTGDYVKFDRNFDQDFLGDCNFAGSTRMVFLAIYARLAAAFGFNVADRSVWF